MIRKIIILLLFILSVTLYSKNIECIIKPGDTIFGLAMKFDTTTSKIMEDNGLKTSLLSIGQKLIIKITEPDEYIVKLGDNLSSIAYKNEITLKHLLLLNRIEETYNIREGDILIIPTTPEIKKEYIVKKGDTLSWISMAYNIDIKRISEINSIKNSSLSIGEKILLTDKTRVIPGTKQASTPFPSLSPIIKDSNKRVYTVKKGDTLLALAIEFETTTEELTSLNNLKSQSINIGQKMAIPAPIIEKKGIMNSTTHTVAKGDTLWSIAQKYGVTVDKLLQYNSLNSTTVRVGKKINIYDYKIIEHEDTSSIKLVSMEYGRRIKEVQPNKDYSHNELVNPLEKYYKAKDLWKKFAKEVDSEEPISTNLKGWTIILDPGHGGKDPGAIAAVTINGKRVYVVEDEYAYDTAVRLYELLKRNGADVYMTILSPDHLSRNPKNGTTFINEKNEVYNSYSLNKYNNNTIWPVGGQWGLNQRVIIANNILSLNKREKTIFISIHADNDDERGNGKLIIFDDVNNKIDTKSQGLAEKMTAVMGSDSRTAGMSLAVFKNNNASYKILIELRNMAHLSEAMALMDNKERQKDALIILNGIKNFVDDFHN